MEHQKILILDFGGQYNQLIARRVREQNVYCDLLPYDMTVEKIREYDPIGIIFTGGPNSVYADNAPNVKKEIFDLGIPVLGICYGCQLIAYKLGGVVTHANTREYGKSEIEYEESPLFDGVDKNNVCWMSHTDYVSKVPEGFSVTATTKTCPAAGFADEKRKIYGIQFHTEVHHTRQGERILHNFLYSVCGAKGDWTMSNFVSEQVANLREKIGDKKVLCAMSGGVDSAVAATLVHKAVGDRLVCVFVDHGLLRKGEADEVVSVFRIVGRLQFDLEQVGKFAHDAVRAVGIFFLRITRGEGKSVLLAIINLRSLFRNVFVQTAVRFAADEGEEHESQQKCGYDFQ